IAENTSTATHIKVADITVTDDALGSNTLGLTGADASFFEIVGNALFLKAGTVLDFESKTNYAVAVTVDDTSVGGTPDAASATYTLNVGNVNEAPTGIGLSNATVAENSANGTVIGTASGHDPDAGATLTYSLQDNAGGRFAINATTGVLTVANGSLLDFETATSHAITVRATDQGGLFHDTAFTILVTDVAPVVDGDGTNNTLAGTPDNDTMHGFAGSDSLSGLGGDDTLIGGTGGDALDGGSGFDTADYSTASAPVTVDLVNPALNTGDAAGDSYVSIE